MKNKQKRIDGALKQLYNMHEELFGQKYSIGVQLNENSEFNKIIDEFRQVMFMVRSTQQERQKRENKKNFKNSPETVRINHQIREDINRAQVILKQAAKLHKGANEDKNVWEHRDKVIKNGYELLTDAKEAERGGIYLPPEIPTFQDIKKNLIGRQYRDSGQTGEINLEEEEAIDKFNENDKQIDKGLQQIINVNERVKNQMIDVNKGIEQTHQKIIQQKKQAEALTQRVNKANKDLQEILKTYRRPSKLCLDITLVLLLLALIGVIISLIKS